MSNDLCKNCGKPPLAGRAGSVTSYFFKHNYCQCAVAGAKQSRSGETSAVRPLCPTCGKSRPIDKKAGSFTSFLFKELRCSCPGPSSRASGGSPTGSDAIAIKRASSGRTQTAYRMAQKKQFTESIKKRQLVSGDSAEQIILSDDSIIGGTYRIISQIGMGGMGVVYLVEQTSLHKQFALKVLAPDLVNEQNWLRFKAEAKTMAALNHPSFVNVYDLGIHAGSTPFYAMDYLKGRSLEEMLVAEGPLKLEQAVNIFIEVLNGLAYAHRNGIIHRDIKPANIMLCTINGANQVKILDFGISKFISSDAKKLQSMTMAGDVFGSPYYMSPEQCTGETVDARSDIYSIGCSLFEALTGYLPFEGSTSLETMIMHQEDRAPRLGEVLTNKSFPKSLEAIVATCLAKLPRDRYQSAKEVVLDLERIRAGKEIEPSSPAYRHLNPPLIKKNGEKAEGEGDEIDSETSSTKLAKTMFLSAAAMAIVILVVASVSFFSKPASKAAIATKAFETAPLKMRNYSPEITKVATEGDQKPCTEYYSRIVDAGNTIQFNFPKDRSLGKIGPVENRLSLYEARYKVTFPASCKLKFCPYSDAFDKPEIFNSFRPSDLHSLMVPHDLNTTLDLKPAMPFIAKITEIRSLNLDWSNIGDEQVVYLNQMPNLETLNVGYSKVTGRGIAKFKRLKELESLSFDGNRDYKAMLLALEGSEKLQRLSLKTLDPPVSATEARLIASCKNISYLFLDESLASDEALEILSDLPKLGFLGVNNCAISSRAIENFKKSYPRGQVKVIFSQQAVDASAFGNESPADWIK